MMDEALSEMVVVGKVSGVFGIRGWIKVYSHTQPRENILNYSPWYLWMNNEWQLFRLAEGQKHGKGVIARLESIDDRDMARNLVSSDIAIKREELPQTGTDEYYWTDLIGLAVKTTEGVNLGIVDYLIETGANDVLVVKGEHERLIPFIQDNVIVDIDLNKKEILVNWDPDF